MDEAALDPNAILASLGCERPGSTERVSGGKDTAIFRVELGGEFYALRVLRPGEDGVARREARVMRAAWEGGVPVPRVRAEGTWRDRAAPRPADDRGTGRQALARMAARRALR